MKNINVVNDNFIQFYYKEIPSAKLWDDLIGIYLNFIKNLTDIQINVICNEICIIHIPEFISGTSQ